MRLSEYLSESILSKKSGIYSNTHSIDFGTSGSFVKSLTGLGLKEVAMQFKTGQPAFRIDIKKGTTPLYISVYLPDYVYYVHFDENGVYSRDKISRTEFGGDFDRTPVDIEVLISELEKLKQ